MKFRLSLPWNDWRWFLQWRNQPCWLQLWWGWLLHILSKQWKMFRVCMLSSRNLQCWNSSLGWGWLLQWWNQQCGVQVWWFWLLWVKHQYWFLFRLHMSWYYISFTLTSIYKRYFILWTHPKIVKIDISFIIFSKVEFFSWVKFILFLLDSFSGCDGTNAYGTECCTPSHHCGIFEGHCDSHQECIGHLRCGANNCFDSFPFATNDCCFDPVPSMFFLKTRGK